MKRLSLIQAILCTGLILLPSGCQRSVKAKQDNAESTGPTQASVVPDFDASHFKVDHPEQFALITAQEYVASPELNVTGVVNPDVSRQVPVISLASGKIVEIHTQLGDEVKKGQLLFKVRSTDVSGAYSDYRKAVVNEELTKVQLDRAKVLYEHGAIPKSALEAAQNAEDDAKVDLDTAIEHLRLLGSDPDHPTGIVNVYAPVSGVITDQQITNAAGVQALSAPNPLTISDMSHVWILCDVYENDLAQVRVGEFADIHVVAYPDKVLKGRISNIGPILDPNLRTAKVRLEVGNPGILRLGMFVTATFHSHRREVYASIPTSAILHLRDREWVYTPAGNGYFRRLEVTSGNMLPDNMQAVISGIEPGTKVISNALDLQHTVSQ
ncbi:MAG: efflux RND transporter periplasmic adaptor subunit [Acidobacteriaceae bacterium]|nr:efflux RND transporter periplasmic adaptor subunit [Acidobacteriaceae bacterium]MBV9498606.1 efflux RND transporter periplasmic adaptor subunit [Acidobacteriaceae bacterium]